MCQASLQDTFLHIRSCYICYAGDSSSLRKRYDALLAGMKQQKERLSDAKMRRQEFDSVLEAFLPSLSALEVRYDGMGEMGDGQSERIQERVETVQVGNYTVIICACGNGAVINR